MSYVKPPASGVIKGMFIPKFKGHGATGDAIALLGALLFPWGTVCSADNLSEENLDRCNDLNLNSAPFLLKCRMCWEGQARWSMPLRFASGQSSTITGTYAGQCIMQGFLDIKMRKWLRNLMTRSIAITSSLIVSIIGGSAGVGRLIIIASMILSFELPFALIPLLKYSSSNTKMGPHKNSIYIIVISGILVFGIMGINIYYLSTGFVDWLLHNNLPKVGNASIGIIVFPLVAINILAVIYLTIRKDTVKGFDHTDGVFELGHVPYREDLADIPLPK
ncbi:hypothetical protein PVL29_023244 [Vitis rotundifolia]|uniref:Uncharacterized protein n=1 Tax=Vitis rotundifolia TaxID=103349 RepID=A0AA38YNC2_VITRO|nr:hypothetical protein PVL29_023244 [Vitis rotundifolia]